jgi:hypothetical protein
VVFAVFGEPVSLGFSLRNGNLQGFFDNLTKLPWR